MVIVIIKTRIDLQTIGVWCRHWRFLHRLPVHLNYRNLQFLLALVMATCQSTSVLILLVKIKIIINISNININTSDSFAVRGPLAHMFHSTWVRCVMGWWWCAVRNTEAVLPIWPTPRLTRCSLVLLECMGMCRRVMAVAITAMNDCTTGLLWWLTQCGKIYTRR